MSSAEHLLEGGALYDDETLVADEPTREVIERRRSVVTHRRGWLIRRMLLLADVLGLSTAFFLAEIAAGPGFVRGEILFFLATLPGWVVIARLYGLYDHDEERTNHSTADEFVGVFHFVTIGAWLLFAGAWLTGLWKPDLAELILFWGVAIALVTAGRAIGRAVCRQTISYLQNTIIVGAGDVGQLVARKLLQHPEYGINLVGFVDAAPKDRRQDLGHLTLLGTRDELPNLVKLHDVERVVIAFSNDSHEETLALIRSLKSLSLQIDIVPRLFEIVGPGVEIHTVEGLPLVSLPTLRLSRSARALKRTLDLVVSGGALLALSPLFAYIALRIKLDSSGPVFFRQVRMGCGDRPFLMYKFRTMVVDADERRAEVAHLNMHAQNGGDSRMLKVPDDPRVTTVGRMLRHLSLDELPQLLNVFRGEMSIVGPRPLPLDEDELVQDWGRHRLMLKPGMTGLWQVSGRSSIPFGEMVNLDYLYVSGWSLWGDLRLIARTFPAVLRGRQAY
jgi:exopolysaccharide biosynthesis polyprenyl glycosylphosphotransferase